MGGGRGEGERKGSICPTVGQAPLSDAELPIPIRAQVITHRTVKMASCVTGGSWAKVASCAKILVPGCLFQAHTSLDHSIFLRAKHAVKVVIRLSERSLNSKIL